MNQWIRVCSRGASAALLCAAAACGGSDATASNAPALKLANSARVGSYLADGSGRSLYYFGKDVPASASAPAMSNCSGGCAAAWPIFHAAGNAVQGIQGSDVGEITRADGSKQTTYRGWPLYYFAGDTQAGDVNGEGTDEVWFVLHDQEYSVALMSNGAGQQPELYLSDGAGHTLYYFFRDTPGTAGGAPVSACTSGTCLASWKIFLAAGAVVPSALDAADFTVFTRSDGQQQSAYKGHPLYFFAGDSAPGDTKGRGVNNLWDTLDPRVL